ncbi:hypothetical protein Godav_029370 [Gossypium davidsonii]|uniref:Uncharacterized protein n=1 Tax=Gossypium davidsonii TaxID=34287 RepID=A0A7J8T7G6_GOSDV|nr:hypothetical protein [Gossypium davidsonii]
MRHGPINSTHIITGPNASTDDTYTISPSDYARLECMAWCISFPNDSTQLTIYRSLSQEGSHEAPSGSSSHYQSPSPYGIQTPSPWVLQTPSHPLFYQGGSSSQHPQPQPLPEQPQLQPEVEPMRNPSLNCRLPHMALISTGTYIDFL